MLGFLDEKFMYMYLKLAFSSPALRGLSLWKSGLGEMVAPVPVTCVRYVQPLNVWCPLCMQSVRWCWHCVAVSCVHALGMGRDSTRTSIF